MNKSESQEDRGEPVPEADRPHLIVLQGTNVGTFYKLESDETVLGSDPLRADIVLREREVEPQHASIHADPGSGSYVLRDLETGGKTALNGETVDGAAVLSDGDRIFLGMSVLEFSMPDPLRARFHGAIHRMLNYDYLTGLLAKPRFDEEFEHALAAARESGEPLGVLMIDIDNLKKINDARGHLLGEFTIQEVGRLIGAAHGEGGRRATRFGGDEFQTILPGLDKAGAREVAEELRRAVEEYAFDREGVVVNPTISVGVAAYPEDGGTTEELTSAADEALYRAKSLGRNVVYC
ncbi:GGDEF domain-containing protein [Rubrobacter taiwanensis]|uniref:GGDEF domain-containing protein n=1 Tax=Rubrobacter taiwanensis TaxID=185139 RepID=A0A4V2NWR2_9ACTN|nr:GGDEF domain-containing protein [Rubrobacter taiwanensis]TCJ18352.1 GGDEF domain-containing protein [Rubrobacter taiwanensis]